MTFSWLPLSPPAPRVAPGPARMSCRAPAAETAAARDPGRARAAWTAAAVGRPTILGRLGATAGSTGSRTGSRGRPGSRRAGPGNDPAEATRPRRAGRAGGAGRRPAAAGGGGASLAPGGRAAGRGGGLGAGRVAAAGLGSGAAGKLPGVRVLAGQLVEDVGDALAQRLRVEAALGVVGDLLGAAPVRLVDRPLHRGGDLVGVHVHLAGYVPRRAPDRLDQRRPRPQEALLVRVQDRHQRHLGQVQPLAEQVDADEDVVLAEPALAQQLD